METFASILLILLAGWLVIDAMRAREQAIHLGARACSERDVQLLDQTVALDRMGIRWTAEGLRLRRSYRFEYSEDGESRHSGHIVLVGARLEELSMGLLSK